MNMKSGLFLFLFTLQTALAALSPQEYEEYISSLGSLTFCMAENQDGFTDEDVDLIWNRTFAVIHGTPKNAGVEKAYQSYQEEKVQTPTSYQKTALHLSKLWKQAVKEESLFHRSSSPLRSKVTNNDFEKNSIIPSHIKRAMRSYVIPNHHPMKQVLDSIFFPVRATINEHTFVDSGFSIISKQPRSYVYVARHPLMPSYLVKAYMDTELRQKRGTPSWKWLVQRCQGAEKIRNIIKYKNIQHFSVPSKWIYPIPKAKSPPKNWKNTRHYALLLVDGMELISEKENRRMWKKGITREHLDELYYILTRARGSSYRPDNIWYSHSGKFAFIDTEYPNLGPDYQSIQRYLSSEMRAYWVKLVKRR